MFAMNIPVGKNSSLFGKPLFKKQSNLQMVLPQESFKEGDLVYFKSDHGVMSQMGWISGKIINLKGQIMTGRMESCDIEIDDEEYYERFPSKGGKQIVHLSKNLVASLQHQDKSVPWFGLENNQDLKILNEATIIHNLRRRFKKRDDMTLTPYTYSGSVCIAVSICSLMERIEFIHII